MPRNTAEYGGPREHDEYDENEDTQDSQEAEGHDQMDGANALLRGNPEALAQHVLERWREPADHSSISGDPGLTKRVLIPMLDKDLAARLTHAENGDAGYGRDLEGLPGEPMGHLQASFARMVRERMDLITLENPRSPDQLAKAIGEHLPAIDAMADYLNAINHELENTAAEWADPAKYQPQVLWERSPEGNWDTVMELAENGLRPEGLADHAADLLDQAARAFTSSRSSEEYLEAAQRREEGEGPRATMLREAMRDIKTALECAQALGNLTEEDRTPEGEDGSAHREVRSQALNDMSRELQDELRGSLSGREMALYDRTLRSLAHADFTLIAIHNRPDERGQPVTD